MDYIAHIRESDKQIQTVEAHLSEVKALAESYGKKIGMKHAAGLAGLLHDLGKYTDEFREYLLQAVEHPDSPPRKGSVDHSTAGGRLLYNAYHRGKVERLKGILAEVVGNAILSHHSYLQDFLNPDLESNYLRRVRDKRLDEYEVAERKFFEHVISTAEFQRYVDHAAGELEAFLAQAPSQSSENKIMLLTKFIFSALIDADRTNTRLFEENQMAEPELNVEDLFHSYYERLLTKIRSFQERPDANPAIQLLRSKMSEQCDQFADKPSGIYTLSIPTGGGKTLASFRYALQHARKYGKKHIVYVVPYTTIIEQNAEEIRKIIKDDAHILEHHSNIVVDVNDDEGRDGLNPVQQKLKLAKDNWDSPIILTTMVQFLNVFYAKGSRNIRRLHHLCESVLIFDEVQKVPIPCVSLFNQALNFLKTYGHSSIVLCTATQPALDFVENKLDINTDAEMIDRLEHVIEAFKRVEIIDRATNESFNNDQLASFIAARIEEVRSVLVILNTKTVVKRLYQRLKSAEDVGNIPVYHLSTSMCAAHRTELLDEIRSQLEKGNKIICISTQLIEAGVDISFDCVIRSLAGLDSIAQAAGRCNRHGKEEIQQVYVIDHAEENLGRLREIKIGKQISSTILVDLKRDRNAHGGSLLSVPAMERYFKEFYTEFESDLDYFIPKLRKKMTELLASDKKNKDSYYQAYCNKYKERLPLFLAGSYGTAAEHFRVIDDLTTSVIVPYKEGKELIADLNGRGSIEHLTRLLRKAQQYTIHLFEHELRQLSRNEGLISCMDGRVLVLKEGAYNKEFGLDIENDSPLELEID